MARTTDKDHRVQFQLFNQLWVGIPDAEGSKRQNIIDSLDRGVWFETEYGNLVNPRNVMQVNIADEDA